jgi:hypothetical protein
MTNLKNILVIFAVALAIAIAPANAQVYTLTSTTLSNAISAGTIQQFTVASVTNITSNPPTMLYVDREAMLVLAVSGTTLTVARGQVTTKAVGHASGAMVLAGSPDWFSDQDVTGSCTTSTVKALPHLNVITGNQWLCSSLTGTWVPGFKNVSAPAQVTAAVASAAGAILPSGPLFHITGTAAITGFTIPVGFDHGSFCAIPDGIFTTTTAGNIALASTAVVNKLLCWTWDDTNSKFVPTY